MSEATAPSLQVIGNDAYYQGKDGRFYRFNGTKALCISAALADARYQVLSAAHSAARYYVLAQREGERCILVYAVESGMWFIEDAADISRLLNIASTPCALVGVHSERLESAPQNTDVLLLEKSTVQAEENSSVEWFCQSGLLGFEALHFHLIDKLAIAFESEVGARVEILVRYDANGQFEPLAAFVSQKKCLKTIPLALRRCQFFELMLRGRGMSKIYRLSYFTQEGSEK